MFGVATVESGAQVEKAHMVFLLPVVSSTERATLSEEFRKAYWPGRMESLASLQLVAVYCYYLEEELQALGGVRGK